MTTPTTTPTPSSAIKELHACRQAEQEAEDCCWAEEDWLFKVELKQLAEEEEWKRIEEEERQKWEEEEQWKLEEAQLWRKEELKEARQGKRKVVETEESREEIKKEPEEIKEWVVILFLFWGLIDFV